MELKQISYDQMASKNMGKQNFKKDFLIKFKNSLNMHPSYLPYNRGRDIYYFSIIDKTPIGICIHKMNEKVDGGKYFLTKKNNY